MRVHGFTLLGILVGGGCFNPDAPEASTSSADETTAGPSATESGSDPTTASNTETSATSTDPSATMTSPDTSLATSADTSTTDDTTDPTTDTDTDGATDESSTGGPVLDCGDGIEAPGELCFDDVVLLESNDVTYDGRLMDVDLDGDGDVVYLIGDQVVTRLGTGKGVFGPALFGLTVFPTSVEAGDIDGDGTTDLAIIRSFEDSLEVALGDGNGDFVLQMPSLASGTSPTQVVVGDLDGNDGDDIIVGGGDTYNVFVSDGDGSPVPQFQVGVGGPIVALGLGEFDGDGDADMIFVRTLGAVSSMFVRLGDGDGTFGSAVPIDVDGDTPRATVGGDLDGDGNGDIVHVDSDLDLVYVLFGNGAGGFDDPVGVATDVEPQQVVVVDLTGDGHLDVAVGHGEGASVWIYPNDGAGALGEPLPIALVGPVDSLASGTGNSDGVPDLITTDTNNEYVTVVLSTP